MPSVTFTAMLRQLGADLIGKDSYRGVTLTYAWLANQLGHFTLGFIPTLLVFNVWFAGGSLQRPELWAAGCVAAFWFLFEVYNFLGPLLKNKRSIARGIYIPKKSTPDYQFQPSWANVAFDTATDIVYFATGAFSAALFIEPVFSPNGWIVIALLAVLAYPAYFWFKTRIYLQTALYPMQSRLSQWNGPISENDKTDILNFIRHCTGRAEPCPGKHLLIFGPSKSGKTALAVGIATEVSNRHVACSYTTAMKLYCLFHEEASSPARGGPLWTWRDSGLLVIDDINPGEPVANDLVDAAGFRTFIDKLADVPASANRERLCSANVIWVLGNKRENVTGKDAWEAMLKEIGVKDGDILSVVLG